jgi:hypothetical protein
MDRHEVTGLRKGADSIEKEGKKERKKERKR